MFVHVSWSSPCSCSDWRNTFEYMSLLHSIEYTWSSGSIGCIGGPIELLLAKVKNASGRIGIFLFLGIQNFDSTQE